MRPESRKTQNNILRKKSTRNKVVSKSATMEKEDKLPMDILRKCNNLKSVCNRIERLEKEKQKLILEIIKYVPKTVSS